LFVRKTASCWEYVNFSPIDLRAPAQQTKERLVSSSTSTENISVIASLGATPDTFAVDTSFQAIVQQQLDNNITNIINLNSPYIGVTVTPISLNSDGTTNSSPPPEPTNTSLYQDAYITGSVTGSGGSITLPNAMTNGVPTNNGIRGIIAAFSGNETIRA
jgi:hypothetical protein